MQREQRTLAVDVKNGLQLAGGEAADGLGDELPGRLHQVAVSGEPHRVPTPQSLLVELGKVLQGVVLPPVRIAAEISQRLQLPKHRHGPGGSQSVFQLCERGDALVFQKATQHVGGKAGVGHVV